MGSKVTCTAKPLLTDIPYSGHLSAMDVSNAPMRLTTTKYLYNVKLICIMDKTGCSLSVHYQRFHCIGGKKYYYVHVVTHNSRLREKFAIIIFTHTYKMRCSPCITHTW